MSESELKKRLLHVFTSEGLVQLSDFNLLDLDDLDDLDE